MWGCVLVYLSLTIAELAVLLRTNIALLDIKLDYRLGLIFRSYIQDFL